MRNTKSQATKQTAAARYRGIQVKNEIEYTREIRGHEYTFTAWRSKAAARRVTNEACNPCLIEIMVEGDRYYDSYPLGHPLPDDATIIEICDGRKWRSVQPMTPAIR